MPTDPPNLTPTAAQERLSLLAQLLAAEEGLDDDGSGAIPRRGASGPAPLSFAQEVLWLLDRATPGLTAYNSPIAFRIRGGVDPASLQRALDQLVARHEALRTVFEPSGERVVQRALDPTPVPIAIRDLRALPPHEALAAGLRYFRELAAQPFELSAAAALRVALVQVADDEHLLLLLTHHIVSDAWSYGVICRELSALYDGAQLAPVRLQIGDYAAWQRELMQGDELERRLAFWRERLAALPVLDLPLDRPRSTVQEFSGARCERVLPRATLDGLRLLAQRGETTLYAVLLVGFQSVLHRYSGQPDIVVGSAVAGRTRSETEGMIGYLSQALPMRTRFDDDPTFAELVARVGEGVLGAFEHQDVPLEALVLDLQRGGRPSHAPLFRVVLTMQDTLPAPLRLGTATGEPLEIDAAATKFDLTLLATQRDDGLELSLWHRTDLFESATAARFLGHLQTLLEAAIAAPGTRVSHLPLLTAAERIQLDAWSANPRSFDRLACVHEAFAAHAARKPHAYALTAGEERLTYEELNARANRLARRLLASGVRRGAPIGLALERGAGAIVALVAILKAGCAYVPLVPELPAQRLAAQIDEAAIDVVVTAEPLLDRLPRVGVRFVCIDRDAATIAAESGADPAAAAQLDELAYVLFTSGSTGVPKGVAVTHRNLANYTAGIAERLELVPDGPLAFATVSTLAADLGNTAIFPALTSGGELHVVPTATTTEPARFAEYLGSHAVDVLKITPSHLAALLAGAGTDVLPARWLIAGGEACSWEVAERVRGAGRCRMLNHYGPTETTVGACTFEVAEDRGTTTAATVPIGFPLANVCAYVLDGTLQHVPIGVPGELCIAGAGVANGYLNRPDLTAERFVADPFASASGRRMYRTGDRVRRLPDGAIEFLGRLDDQVKIRGYRVELGEIEAVLASHPDVAGSAAAFRTAPAGGDARLLAYATLLRNDAGADATVLRTWLGERLAEHMIPDVVTILPELPLTANGKLDRARLPEPPASGAPERAYVAPRTPTEVAMAALWAEVLKVERVGVNDEFLDLGGHSIVAIRLLGKLSRAFGVRISLRTLFDGPTVAQLAATVDEARARAAR